jgi:hypothetical protein
MSQTQLPVGSQATQEAARELMNEISFQKVLLSSIDDSVEDRDAAEDEVRTEIRRLENELRALKRGSGSETAESATYSPAFYEAEAASSPNISRLPDRDVNDIPSTLLSPHQPASSSTGSIAELLTPSKMDLPTRKRSHSKHLDGLAPVTDNKSRRTSPSPFSTYPSTPSSVSGYDCSIFADSFFNSYHSCSSCRLLLFLISTSYCPACILHALPWLLSLMP